MRNVAVQQAKKAAKSAAAFTKKAVQAVAKAASTIINALAGLAGGGVLLVALLVVALIAAIVSSPFGIFLPEMMVEASLMRFLRRRPWHPSTSPSTPGSRNCRQRPTTAYR